MWPLKTQPDFDEECIANLNSADEVVDFLIDNGYKFINDGSSRHVYRLDDKKVIKVARDASWVGAGAGVAQNENEVIVSQQHKESKLLAHVISYHPKYIWVISELAQKSSWDKVSDFLVNNRKDLYNMGLEMSDIRTNNLDSFGEIKRKVVVVDYGLTKDIYIDYYQGRG